MMGPEGALLNGRFGRARPEDWHSEAYERAKDSVYVEVAVRSKLDEFLGPGHSAPAPGVWAKMRAAWRAPSPRAVPGPAGSVAAAPIVAKAEAKAGALARSHDANDLLAALPLRRDPRA